ATYLYSPLSCFSPLRERTAVRGLTPPSAPVSRLTHLGSLQPRLEARSAPDLRALTRTQRRRLGSRCRNAGRAACSHDDPRSGTNSRPPSSSRHGLSGRCPEEALGGPCAGCSRKNRRPTSRSTTPRRCHAYH